MNGSDVHVGKWSTGVIPINYTCEIITCYSLFKVIRTIYLRLGLTEVL